MVLMNLSKRRTLKSSRKINTEKVPVPILSQALRILSKSKKGVYRITEGADRVLSEKCRDKPPMTVQIERDTIARFSIPILPFWGYLS